MFVVNRNFQIQDANNKFKQIYPHCQNETNALCYKIIPHEERDTPCPDCLVRTTFFTGMGAAAKREVSINGKTKYYRKETSPLYSENGEITAVMEMIEDITAQVEATQNNEKHSLELKAVINKRIEEQHQKECKLNVLVNTAYELKSANGISESIDRIICGYKQLHAAMAAFALFDNDDMCVVKIYPHEVLTRLNFIFKSNITGTHIRPNKHPQNPFVQAALLGKPLFFKGEREIYDFLKSCYPKSFDHEIAEAASMLQNLSVVIFPLKTKDVTVGAIAVFADIETLEQNFEYYSFLSNSSAMEISRQQNSEKLLKSELKYRNLVESSQDMILLCSSDGKIQYSNRIFKDTTGVPERTKKDLSIYSFFANGSREKVKRIITSGMKDFIAAEPLELKMQIPSGKELWTEMVFTPMPGEEQGFQIVARDVTRRRNMEHLIGNLSEFHEKILQNDLIGIITTDLGGEITSWNRGAAKILGYETKEILNKSIMMLIHEDSLKEFEEIFNKNQKNLPQIGREIKFKKKNGQPVSVMYIESTMKDEEQKTVAVIIFFFDNTEKMRLMEQWQDLTQRLQQAQLITIVSLAKLAEYRDIETGLHLERIMRYTELLANELTGNNAYKNYITKEYITDLVNSCPLHDIGKVGIPDVILHKPGKLTPREFEVIKKHTIIGGDTIAEAEKKLEGRSYLNLGREIAYYHHERWDGNGYPLGLKGENIPLSARIVAVADVYDALISKRPYKEAFPHQTAVDIIKNSSNTHFDESIVKAFMNCEKEFACLKNAKVH